MEEKNVNLLEAWLLQSVNEKTIGRHWILFDCLMGILWQCVFQLAEIMRFSLRDSISISMWYTACLHFAQMTNTIANRNHLIRRPQICTSSSEETWTYKSTPTETAMAVPAGCLMKHLFIPLPLYFCDYSFKRHEQDADTDSVWPRTKTQLHRFSRRVDLQTFFRHNFLFILGGNILVCMDVVEST